MTTWHVYRIPPIDFGWCLPFTLDEFKPRWIKWMIEADETHWTEEPKPPLSQFKLEAQWVLYVDEVMTVAKKGGWEGDFREDMRVVAVPADTEWGYAFVWKQDNNGNCFIVMAGEWPRWNEWLEYEGEAE